jgi:hypothetical protein
MRRYPTGCHGSSGIEPCVPQATRREIRMAVMLKCGATLAKMQFGSSSRETRCVGANFFWRVEHSHAFTISSRRSTQTAALLRDYLDSNVHDFTRASVVRQLLRRPFSCRHFSASLSLCPKFAFVSRASCSIPSGLGMNQVIGNVPIPMFMRRNTGRSEFESQISRFF